MDNLSLTTKDRNGNLFVEFGDARITFVESTDYKRKGRGVLKIQVYKNTNKHESSLGVGTVIIIEGEGKFRDLIGEFMMLNKAVREKQDAAAKTESPDVKSSPLQKISNSCTLGQLVKLKEETMGNKVGTTGVCFNVYHLGSPGAQIIFPNGEYCGFSLDEQKHFFELGQIMPDYCNYIFRNVMVVSKHHQEGLFCGAFDAKFISATEDVPEV